jgi:hypothetical protein
LGSVVGASITATSSGAPLCASATALPRDNSAMDNITTMKNIFKNLLIIPPVSITVQDNFEFLDK